MAPFEAVNPITVIELKLIVSKHTRIIANPITDVKKLSHRASFTLDDHEYIWNYRNMYCCNTCTNNHRVIRNVLRKNEKCNRRLSPCIIFGMVLVEMDGEHMQ